MGPLIHYLQLEERERWGLRAPQTCARGMIPLDPQLANEHSWNKQTSSVCCAGVTKNLRSSGPKSLGKSEGESKLSPADYSLAFPDAKHPGWRLRRRARSTTIPSQTSAFLPASAGTKQVLQIRQYPLLRSRGRSPLVQGYGGRIGPCLVVK